MTKEDQQTKAALLEPMTQQAELHRALLKQIHGMYDNPELKRVCQEALKGNWDAAFYEKYKPEGLKKK